MALADTKHPRHLWPRAGEQGRVITDVVTIKATAMVTGEAHSLFEVTTPSGSGCPAHTQRYDDETFYVLEGSYAFLIRDREIVLDPGACAFAPRGTLHGYTNVGADLARMLVLVTPGGIQETFFDEVGNRAGRSAWAPDMAKVLAVAPKYGIEFALSPAENEGARTDF